MNAVILLFLAGILLLAFEIITPGGVLGILGTLAMAAGCGIAFYRFGVNTGATATGVAVLVLGLMIWLELMVLPKTKFGRKFFQERSIDGTTQPPLADTREVVGKTGEAITTLAPSGYVLLDGRRYEAFSQSGYAQKGAAVRVVGLDNFRLIVTKT